MDANADAKAIIERTMSLRTARANFENNWETIARYMAPIAKGFSTRLTPGQKRHRDIYHSGPLEAVENFKAGLFAGTTPPWTQWMEVQHVDEDLNEFGPVKEYFRLVSRRVWKSYGAGVSRFYNNVPLVHGNMGVFGTGILFSAEVPGTQRILDSARSLAECYVDVDAEGNPDTLIRVYRLSARSIANNQEWITPGKVALAAEKPDSMGQLFTIIHAVWPISDKEARGRQGKKWVERYVVEEDRAVISKDMNAGYFEFPYHIPRWSIAEGEAYGRGLGDVALADVLSLQVARKSNIGMMDRVARPTILTASELDIGGGVAPYPGEIVTGGMSADGKRLVAPMEEGKNPVISLEMEDRLYALIQDTFKFGLMQIVGSYNMTATEYQGRAAEAQRLLGPNLGNVEVDLLSPSVKRRVGILERAGQLPPPPEELKRYGGGIEVKFVGMANRLQQMAEGEAAVRTIQALQLAGQVAPEVLDRIDPDATAEIIVDGFGSDILRAKDVAQQMRDQREAQQQAAMMAEQAPGVAGAVKDIAEARQISQGGGARNVA